MIRIIVILMLWTLAPAPTAVLAGPPAPPDPSANPMHPAFVVRDDSGNPAAVSGRPAAAQATCGTCHDAGYISAHSDHWNDRVHATCVQCHFEGGQFPLDPAAYDETGMLRRTAIKISAPRDDNCASCHGIVHPEQDPLSLPLDFGPRAGPESAQTYDLTMNTGAIFSAQDVAGSYLNLRAKEAQTYPWDAHARRLVHCVDCHYSPNNPAISQVRQATLGFLKEDPRRIPLSQFLHQPDHRMAAATCRSCHDPLKSHDFLPYKQRHFSALECQACHVPHPMGPAARMIDASVLTPARQPVVEYRGLEPREGESMNAAYALGYSPLLLPHRGPDGETKLAPFNAVDTWFWADGANGPAISTDLIAKVFLNGDHYASQIIEAFDANRDGRLSGSELRLDSAAKTDLVRSRLCALGVHDPRIRREVSFHALEHGVQAGEQVQRDCADCHAKHSRLSAGLALASYTPFGADPSTRHPAADPSLSVRIESGRDGASAIPGTSAGLYILGHTRQGWADRIGLTIFIAVVMGVATHAFFRMVSRPARGDTLPAATERVYLYSAYERLWHWLMGFSILVLMLTGLQVHFFGAWHLLSLSKAVAVHNFFAVMLTVNAFLSLFYHLSTSAIGQFLPLRKNLVARVAAQARYYARGIFLGQPHPSPKTPERKLNPLQQITYLALLNVLFPLQVVTGILIWGASRWPHLARATGGLSFVAPLHSLCAWFFLAFALVHVYLTTTGTTVFSNIIAMVDGFDQVELKRHSTTGGSNA